MKAVLIFAVGFLVSGLAIADNHNITSQTLGSALGISNLEYSYKIASHVTLGLTAATGKADVAKIQMKGSAYGLIARLYWEPAFEKDSWYLVTSAEKRNYEISATENNVRYEGTMNKTIGAVGMGYHWFWDSFNVGLAALATNQDKLQLNDPNYMKYKDDFDMRFGIELIIGGKF